MVLSHHPDKISSSHDLSVEPRNFQDIQLAWETLRNDESRRKYIHLLEGIVSDSYRYLQLF